MALVKCPDCGTDVSEQAPACVRCGRPMRESTVVQEPSAPEPTTIEQTGKSYKGQQLAAMIILITGMLVGIANDDAAGVSAMLMAVGLLWFLSARIGAWWNHG